MGSQVPLGRRESQILEFKSAEALRNPFSISREVVGMLNSKGGSTWIGIKEANGIAVEAEDIPQVEQKRQALLDHLMEVIEPRLRPEDLSVHTVKCEGKDVLVVRVEERRSAGPFALVKDGGRHFVVRIDHRNRPMTREEIFPRDASSPSTTPAASLIELRDRELARGRSGLWVGVLPVPALEVDTQSKELAALLVDPGLSGNRESGWNFRYPAVLGTTPRFAKERCQIGGEGDRETTIWNDGRIEFWAPMIGLKHGLDSAREIYPLALLEYTVSIMRLAKAIFSKVAAPVPARILFDLALFETKGWHLPSYPPETYGYAYQHGKPAELEEGQFQASEPLQADWSDFEESPDHAGFLLVRALYQAFGLPEERIPRKYDRATRRLVI